MRVSNIDNVVCKPTDLTGLMTPGPERVCPGCGKFNLMIDPSYL